MKRVIILLVGLVVLGIIIVAVFLTFSNKKLENRAQIITGSKNVIWNFDYEAGSWVSTSTAPNCPEPLLEPPVDLTNVNGILYPGQYRGGDYKPHGGLSFDDSTNKVLVTAPMDGYLFKVSRHMALGELQNSLYFINNCGFMYKLDHLLVLTPKFQEIVETTPLGEEGDSRTTNINPVLIAQGEEIATEVGFRNFEGRKNVFLDFGLYDLRNRNESSEDRNWTNLHKGEEEYSFNGVCFFEFFDKENENLIRSLPAGGKEGKVSDYCK